MNKIFFKRSIVGALLAGVLVFTAVPAQAAFLDDIQSQLLDLVNRISNLKKSIEAAPTTPSASTPSRGGTGGGAGKSVPSSVVPIVEQDEQEPSWCHTFNTNLRFGDSGDESFALQTALLKAGFDAGAEMEEGAFGERTASAVVGFQQKYTSEILAPFGLQYGTGFVGKATRAKLNFLYGCDKSGVIIVPPPIIVPIPPSPKDPAIRNLDPSVGLVGSKITVAGSGFTSENNTVRFGSGYIKNLKSETGAKLEFAVPSGLDSCPQAFIPCGAPIVPVEPGKYSVSVVTARGTSNSVTFTVLGQTTPTPPPIVSPSVGDVTGDKKVDIGDALFIAQYVAGKRQLTAVQLKQADVNQDGQVSTNDSKLIAMYAIGADNLKALPVSLRVGDANLDGNISVADTLLIAQHAAGTRTLTQTQLAAADVNNDDKVTQADVQTIADFLVGKVQKLPFPAAPLGGGTITLPVEPSVTVLSPNGGEMWEIGKTYDITWNAQGVDSVVLMLEDDNIPGQRVAWTIGVVPAAQGKYSWIVPSVRSGSVKPGTKFKITLNGATARDSSNSYFGIAQPPTVTPPPITSVGDVNSDKKVDMADALLIAQYVAGKRTLTAAQLKQADVNQDGQVSTNDTKLIAIYAVGADNVKSLPVYLRVGDVNFDKNVSAADTLLITQYVAGTRTLTQFQLAAADVNNDDKVTQADADTIANYVTGKVQKLPFPAAPLSVEQKLLLAPVPEFVPPSLSDLPIQNVVIAKYVLSADTQGSVTLNQIFIDLAKGTDAFDSSDVKNLYVTSADGAFMTAKKSNPATYANSYAIDYDGELQPGQSLKLLVYADILESAADADNLPDTMAIDMSVTAVTSAFKGLNTGKVQGQTLTVSSSTGFRTYIPRDVIIIDKPIEGGGGSSTYWIKQGGTITSGGGSNAYFIERGGIVVAAGGSNAIYVKAGGTYQGGGGGSNIIYYESGAIVASPGGPTILVPEEIEFVLLTDFTKGVRNPYISSLYPYTGEVGQQITLAGSFEAENDIHIGSQMIPAVFSRDRSNVSFTIPSLPSGFYQIYVSNHSGKSNVVSLKVQAGSPGL